jgi:8-oxo-dGTP diphosphatase
MAAAVKLHPARADEVDAFIALLEDAAVWLSRRGIAQWRPGSMRVQHERLGRAQRDGELLLARDGGQLVGGLVATRRRPPSWDDRPLTGALYVEKLTVAADRHGRGIGAAMLDAMATTARTNGIAALRLTCVADNPVLVRYYTARGFYPRGEVDDRGTRVLRLERALAWQLPDDPFEAPRWATLLFVVAADRVLLIHKQRGHGAGKINGPGGMVEPGETFTECALRETAEEVGLAVEAATPMTGLRFRDRDGTNLLGVAFRAERFRGTPVETAEAVPFWCPIERLPFGEMWADDILWLPWLLDRQPVIGDFYMDNEQLLAHRLERTTVTALERLAGQRR